jgi:hypothetical protein
MLVAATTTPSARPEAPEGKGGAVDALRRQPDLALVIACGRCNRAGRYPVATLIEKHGRSFPIPILLRTLSADCPSTRLPPHMTSVACTARSCEAVLAAAEDRAEWNAACTRTR